MIDAEPEVVVTGSCWMGSGVGAIETALREMLAGARQEVALTAYAMSGGAAAVCDWLEEALARGVVVNLIVDHLAGQAVEIQSRLHSLCATYPHFCLYDFGGDDTTVLHAKAVVVDRSQALVGSSNLTWRGMAENYELGLLVTGRVAENVAAALDRLKASSHAKQVGLIACGYPLCCNQGRSRRYRSL
jgi:phosphatidylserine/phosphatidylglycerophosphate/cardiolipin synthase-like enzyme